MKWFMFRYMYMYVCMNHWMFQFCKYSTLLKEKKWWHPLIKQEFLGRAVRSATNRPTNLTNPSTALPVYARLVGTSHSHCRPFGSWILTAPATETGSYKGRISVSTIWLHVHCMNIHIYIYIINMKNNESGVCDQRFKQWARVSDDGLRNENMLYTTVTSLYSPVNNLVDLCTTRWPGQTGVFFTFNLLVFC